MKSFAAFFIPLLAALPYVHAHGFVSNFVVDGKSFKGNEPGDAKISSPIRLISDNSPVKGASNKNLNCGLNAVKAKEVADVTPGSNMTFSWLAGGGQNWPHNIGPIITYLASCGSTSCDQFDPTNAQFFKIHQLGKKPGSDTWFQQDFMDGKSISVPLPDNLQAGGYMVRHEIIALHLADSMGGAEFYPSCTQINVTGDGNGVPAASDLVKFPGGYKDNDAGIFVPDVFNPGSKYTFPGPQIVTLSGSADSNSNTTASSSSDSASASATSTPTAAGSASSASATSSSSGGKGHCKAKKRSFSRVMRRITFSQLQE